MSERKNIPEIPELISEGGSKRIDTNLSRVIENLLKQTSLINVCQGWRDGPEEKKLKSYVEQELRLLRPRCISEAAFIRLVNTVQDLLIDCKEGKDVILKSTQRELDLLNTEICKQQVIPSVIGDWESPHIDTVWFEKIISQNTSEIWAQVDYSQLSDYTEYAAFLTPEVILNKNYTEEGVTYWKTPILESIDNTQTYTAGSPDILRKDEVMSCSADSFLERLTPDKPLDIGWCIFKASASGEITLTFENSFPVKLNPHQFGAVFAITQLCTIFGFEGFGPTIRQMLPLIKTDDWLAKTQDGSSPREVANLYTRFGRLLGLQVSDNIDTPEAVLSSMENLRGRTSYMELARQRGLTLASGLMNTNAFITAFQNTWALQKS